jgi:tetratricopeptide (TPR) repeat protein
MRVPALVLTLFLVGGAAYAKGGKGDGKPTTIEGALADAESALDGGRLGDAISEAEKLQKTHGLTKEERGRLDLVIARCDLFTGKYDASEKLFARMSKQSPDDTRLAEWYARALEGAGKDDAAFTLLNTLAQKDALQDGDSYWALAQLERKKGDDSNARAHAKLALEKPIVLQSDELDHAIHKFIDDLAPKTK